MQTPEQMALSFTGECEPASLGICANHRSPLGGATTCLHVLHLSELIRARDEAIRADEWVEVDEWPELPEGARVRHEWALARGADSSRRFVHRDDLPPRHDPEGEPMSTSSGDCDREHEADDEWVEVDKATFYGLPSGARVRQEWERGAPDGIRYFAHRDDLPDPDADAVERMAKAIFESHNERWEDLADVLREHYRRAARAALAAYREEAEAR